MINDPCQDLLAQYYKAREEEETARTISEKKGLADANEKDACAKAQKKTRDIYEKLRECFKKV